MRIREGRLTLVWRLGVMPTCSISSRMPAVPPWMLKVMWRRPSTSTRPLE